VKKWEPKRLGSEEILLTPEIADVWLELNHPLNRRLKPDVIAAMVRDQLADNWTRSTSAAGFDEDGYLVEGQHRATSVKESGKPIRIRVEYGLTKRDVANIDTGAKRTVGDVVKITGLTPEGVNPVVLGGAARLVQCYDTGRWAKYTATESRNFLANNPAITAAVVDCQTNYSRVYGFLSPTVACGALYLARRVDEAAANEFFSRLNAKNFHGEGDPVLALDNCIEKMRDKSKRYASGDGGRRRLVRCIARTWNAYRDGEELTIVRPPNDVTFR
jgi:hypothetical protein